MKKMNKLVALLLAAVMVLGLMPTMSAHAHAHGVEVQGIEEYPVIALDTETAVNITEGGQEVYFTFTPEVTDLYYFYGNSAGYVDTVGNLYDANMNLLASNDMAPYDAPVTVGSGQFFISHEMQAGTTYVLGARMWSSYSTASFTVTLTQAHNYQSAVTKEPTCAEDGIRTYTCTLCGDSYEEAIPSVHNYGEEDGKCIYCGVDYLVTGTCGENMTWSLDWFGTLTISGTGDMDNYASSYYGTPAPWYNQHRNQIKTVVIEDGVTSVGNYAFYQCMNLASVTMTDSVTKLGSYAFHYCYALSDVTLSDNITEFPNYCFSYTAITDLDWPANLTTLGSNSFASSDLAIDRLPEGLTTIGQYAFSYCSNISKLTLPTTVTTLDSYAFYGMYYLKEVVFTGDAPSISNSAFYSITATVWYPMGNETWTDSVKQQYGGTLTWQSICGDSHAFSEPQIVPAACEKGSYEITSCTVCGYTVIGEENDDALGHDYITEHYDGGCGDERYDIITCSRCDYYSEANWAWNDHVYESSQVPATCEEEGYVLYTCVNCGYSYQGTRSSALGHNVPSWSDATEVTCTEDSTHSGICERCSKTVTEVVTKALGHNWDKQNGVENADGTISYPCTRCDATYTTEGFNLYVGDNNFSLGAGDGHKTKTFHAEGTGSLTITISGLSYFNNWTGSWASLDLDEVFAEGFFNIFVNGVSSAYTVNGSGSGSTIVLNDIAVNTGDAVTVELYQLEESYYYLYTVQCNMNLVLTGSHEHSFGDWAVTTAPTCTEDGVETRSCACGETETRAVAALGHTEQAVSGTAPTFDNTGLTDGVICATCGETLIAQEIIPALDYNEGIIPVSALTATAGDWQTGYEATEGPASLVLDGDFDTLWHTNWYGTSRENHWIQFEIDGNYLVDGLRYKPRSGLNRQGELQLNGTITEYKIQVSNDGVHFEDVITGNWDANADWKIAEFDAQAVKFVRLVAVDACTDNDYVFASAAEIRLTGVVSEGHRHNYEADVTEPTCISGGFTTYTCSCGDSYIADETDALGHDYVAEFIEPTCYKSGYTLYTCTRCGKTYKDDPVEPEHKWNEGTVTPPTCVDLGYTTYTCLICGLNYVDEASWVPATGHIWNGTECTGCDLTRENPFEDVDAVNHSSFFDAILWAVQEGITTGTDDTHFSPNGECMRATIVTFLWRAAGEPEPASNNNPFSDVKESDFYYKAVLWAVEKGITNGMTATTFEPLAKCNRAQVVTFLYRANEQPKVESTQSIFSDVKDEGAYYYDAVLWAVENGITNGMGDGIFGVSNICNRAQVVTFLYRCAK